MQITKREFLRLTLGGLVADQVAKRINAAHGIPHVPTVSTVASVHDEDVCPDNSFWQLQERRHIDQWDVQPGSIYGRFESYQLGSGDAYMKYSPPYFDNKWHHKTYPKKTAIRIQEDHPPHQDWIRLRDGSRLDPTRVYYRVQRFDTKHVPPEHPQAWDTQFWTSTFDEAKAWADANETVTGYEMVHNPPAEWKPMPGVIDGGFAQGHVPFSLDVFGSGPDGKEYKSASYTDTNMNRANRLMAPEQFAVFGASIILDRNTSDEDVVLFERNVHFQLWIQQKWYLMEHASRITTRADMDQLVDRAGFPTSLIPAKMHRCDPPVVIDHERQFKFELSGPAVEYGEFGGFVWLDGYWARGLC